MVHVSLRGLLSACIVIFGIGVFQVVNNSKEKADFDMSSGVITYFENHYQNLPVRHEGDYRYIQIDSYPFVFEIYEPNSLELENSIDDLKEGDSVDVYYYETSNTAKISLNKFAQFIDKDGQAYFVRNHFQRNLAYLLIVLSIVSMIATIIIWKNGGIEW